MLPLQQRLKWLAAGLSVLRPDQSFKKETSKNDAQEELQTHMQTKDMDYWNHVLRPKITYLDLMVPCLFRDDQGKKSKTKCIPPTVKRGDESVVIWGCRSAAGTGELQFIEGTMNTKKYCDILEQSRIPFLLGNMAAGQYSNIFNDPKHTSKMTTAWLKTLNSMPKSVKAVLENNGGHTKY